MAHLVDGNRVLILWPQYELFWPRLGPVQPTLQPVLTLLQHAESYQKFYKLRFETKKSKFYTFARIISLFGSDKHTKFNNHCYILLCFAVTS